jgi:hypothetical protein
MNLVNALKIVRVEADQKVVISSNAKLPFFRNGETYVTAAAWLTARCCITHLWALGLP